MTIAAFLNTKLAFLKRHYFPELITLFVVFGVVGVFVSIYAGQRSNLPIPYQGRLLDSNYIPVADGTHYIQFGIYDSATGGNCLWRTEQPGSGVGCSGTATSTPVTVNRGIFTAYLGNGDSTNDEITSSITNNFNSGTYYLGITACGTANSCDAEMTPRRQIGGVPYAYNADFLDGLDSSSFGVFTGVAGGQTIIGGTAANNKLTFMGTSASGNTAATSSIIFLVGDTGSTTAATILNNGFFGIGTSTPSSLLTIGGRIVSTTPSLTGGFFSFASSTLTDNGTAAGGTATNATFLSIAQGALTAQNAVTTTNAYSLYLAGAPTIGTNNTSTNAIALGIGAGNVGTQINSYGLYVNAQTGATNNYAGVFTGGNVGVGTTSPVAILDVASSTLASGTGIRFSGPTSGTTMTGSAFSLSSYIGNGGRLLNLSGTGSPASNGDTLSNAYSILSHAPSVTSTAYNIYSSTTDGTNYGNTVYGQYANVDVTGNVNTTKTAYGTYVAVGNVNAGADQGIRNTYGGYFNITGNTNGTATAYGVYSNVNAGAADIGYGLYTNVAGPNGTTNYGLYIDATTGVGTKYGVYVDVGTTATNRYSGIFLNGNFGIGTSTPQALLTIAGALSGTPSSSTGAYFTFATSTYTDTGTASGGTATSSSFITLNQAALESTNNVTTTDAYTLFIAGGPVKGANNTSTNAIALGIGGGNVGTQINSYGLYVTTQIGAANNYAATFMNGAVLVNATTTFGRFSQKFEVNQAGDEGGIAINTWVNDTTAGILDFNKSNGGSVGTQSVVAQNGALGNIVFRGSDGANFQTAASIAANVDGATISSSSMPGRLVFFTTLSGSTTLSERMRIDNAGHIELSGTAPSSFSANCGSSPSPSLSGNDIIGKFTIGGSSGIGQPCVITFASTWTNAPACVASNETTATSTRATSTATTLGLYNFAAGDVVSYICMGRR